MAALGALASAIMAGLLCAPSHAAAQIPCRYEITHIIQGPPCGAGYAAVLGQGISPNGRYACGYVSCVTTDRAFFYDTQTSQLVLLPHPTGISISLAYDVSDAGLVVGGFGGSAGDFGFIYNIATGQYTQIPPGIPVDGTCSINAINSKNVVCGTRTIGGPPSYPTSAFIRWPDGTMTELGVLNGPSSGASDINDDPTVIGWTGNSVFSPNTRVFIHHNGSATVLGPIPQGINSIPVWLNSGGEFVLSGQLSQHVTRSYVWNQGTLTELVPLQGYQSSGASCLTDSGIALGHSYTNTDGSVSRACLWQNGVPVDLIALIRPNPNANVEGPIAVSHSGQIMASGTTIPAAGVVALVLTPEPTVPGDATCDGVANVNDLLVVINQWGPCSACRADLNGDGVVNAADLFVVIENWSF